MNERELRDKIGEVYLRWAAESNIRQRSRADWRSICRGEEDRVQLQRSLLGMANAATAGTRADVLALLQAAHAVLPLHGPELADLATELLLTHPVSVEWCDALVAALAEQPHPDTRMAAEILDALRQTAEISAKIGADHMRLKVLLRQVLSLGYKPAWILKLTEPA